MFLRKHVTSLSLLIVGILPLAARADTYVIPFSDIRTAMDDSGDSADGAIRAYLAGLLRNELDALGFDLTGGVIIGDIPVNEITRIIETNCNFPRPYAIHTDATTATLAIDDGSSLTIKLDSLRSINLTAGLTGTVSAATTAWVRWGQDVPFGKDCATISTDHGSVGLTSSFDLNLSLAVALNPTYDSDVIGIVVDKQATLTGQAQITGSDLQHDFGTLSPTDLVLSAFEDELLQELQANGEQAIADAIVGLNYRLDGRDESGNPDPAITPFNGPTTYVLDVSEEDQAFVRELLSQFGIPDLVISMLDDRGVEILLQLAILEGAERDAYLAELGASVGCDALLGTYEISLPAYPVYTLNGQSCEIADRSGPDAAPYYSDESCSNEVAFEVTGQAEFCQARFGDQADTVLGNAAAWEPVDNQANDPLPGTPSRPWTSIPSTQLDIGVLSLQGNHQPYMKRLGYKVLDVPRGNGRCELEMRVYKNDLVAEDLRPLMAIHGGTWRSRGFSFLGLEAGISQLTERGFIVFAPFYRLVGESDGNVECNGASWHEVTEDVASALDWIRTNGPALGASDEPVTVYGQSAGAHLSAWLAAHRPADVRKALLYYAPLDALAFLAGAVPLAGPYDAFRDFGLNSLSRFFGASGGSAELQLEHIDFGGLTADVLRENWATLIPGTVFDLSRIDPVAPPPFAARCAAATEIDLAGINLAMPPDVLTACMQQDLRDFLVDNSFYHLLSGEAVPVHVVHGTADTLVPYQQAIGLCEAIDERMLSADVVEPLTVYACGTASEVQIIDGAEHALDLGVCLGSLCPAGAFDSLTRPAVAAAMETAYAWLLEDPAPPADPPAAEDPPVTPPVAGNEPGRSGIGAFEWPALLLLLAIYLRRRSVPGTPADPRLGSTD